MSSDIPVIEYGNNGAKSPTETFWWKAKKEDLHTSVFSTVLKIRTLQSFRKADNIRHARLYSNTEFDRFVAGVTAGLFGKKITFNVSKACVDTACSKISTAKTRPLFLTEKGNAKQQKRAKKLTQYMDGMFISNKVYARGKECFRDAAIFGTGPLKIFEKDGQIAYERTFIDEIVVDDLDGRLGKPRQMHHCQIIHREILKEMFAEGTELTTAIAQADAESRPNKSGITELIEVIESWHLPSSPDAKDGRHTICIKNKTLLDEPWKHSFFPFAFMRWSDPILGFYGEGLVSELIGIQLEINMLLLRIKEAQELMAVPRIFVEDGSSVNTGHITDEVSGIIKYRGTKPDAVVWPAMNGEIYSYLEYLFKKAFEVTGISQLAASSIKPAGLDSRVALREYQDIQTERFAMVAERYQDFFLEISRITIEIQRELEEADPGSQKVNVKSKKFLETIKWKEVDMDDDKFIMQTFPTNFLPKTPEGKLQFTQELIQSGFIDPDWGLELLDFPDLSEFFSLKTAAIDDVREVIEKIIEDEEYTAPEEYMNLQLCVQIGQASYLRAKTDGTGEIALELLQRFIDDSQDLIKAMTPPQLPMGQPPLNAQPAPKPQSDLIPLNGAAPQ